MLLGPEKCANLNSAYMGAGGQHGFGERYWMSAFKKSCNLLGDTDVSDSASTRIITKLSGSRALAFTREYVIADDTNWGLPFLAKLYFLLEECPAYSSLVVEDIKKCFRNLNKLRYDCVMMDQWHLVQYMQDLMSYTLSLKDIAQILKVHLPDTKYEENLLKIIKTLKRNQKAIECRKVEERKELNAICTHLQLTGSQYIEQAERVSSTLVAMMSSDSHELSHTKYLAPSKSLQNATNEPWRYLSANTV